MAQNQQINFAFLGIPSRGHTTPCLLLVKALIALGCKITFFNTLAFKDLIEEAGAKFVDYGSYSLDNISIPISLMEPHEVTIELQKIFFVSTVEILPVLSLHHTEERFDAVIYDQMALWGQIFADQQHLVSFCSNTMFLFSRDDIISQLPKLVSGFDAGYEDKLSLIKNVYDKCKSYKDVLDIQTATRSDYVITYYAPVLLKPTIPKGHQTNDSKIISLGNRFDSGYCASTTEFTKKSMIYISLGTVFNSKNDLFELFIDVFNETEHQVIISTGGNETIYQTLKQMQMGPNIQIYKFVDQLEILSKSSLFITHAGFNSIYEAIYLTVPMLMIPHVPEQYFNAYRIEELSAGLVLRKEEKPKDGLKHALQNIARNWQIYKNSTVKIRQSFLNSYDNTDVGLQIIERVKMSTKHLEKIKPR